MRIIRKLSLTAMALAAVVGITLIGFAGCGGSKAGKLTGDETSQTSEKQSNTAAGKLYTYHPSTDSTKGAKSVSDSTDQRLMNLPPKPRLPISEKSFLSRFERRNEPIPGQTDSFSDMAANEDSATAVDDDVWRQFDIAQEYYQMGVLANELPDAIQVDKE